MTSERMRRRLDAFLDEADEAASRDEWPLVANKARAVLALEADNADALGYLKMAEANLSASPAIEVPRAAAPQTTTIEQPFSFVAGRYAVRRFLGEGGKKKVYLAHDERLDRDVAFALIKTEGLDEVGRERITREAQAMGRMGSHPHVVTIFEIGEEKGAPYVVTELLGGGDVEALLAAGPLPLARTLEIAKGVARGLVFAHEQGLVHRDLKPGNVWLTAAGVAKIGDFGLAVALDRSRLTTHGLMVGTVAYMPPEQALGGEVTPQADLYSLGAMLYELVTGRPPFAGDSPTAIISQHINTPPVAPSWNSEQCPPDLEALILRLLAKVPADRPASAAEVLAALERVDPEAPSVRHSDSSANPLDRLARGVFVGRERELERLRSAFDDAFAGRGSVVMLVGEPGIGKTRTVQELSTYARMRGAKVLWGRAHEASGAPPYWPWRQVATAYRDQTPDEIRRAQYEPYAVDLQRIFPNLRVLFPNLPEPPPVDSEEAQFQLFDALSSFFRAVSIETPLVIVLDDLHWADRSTLRMLTHLAREVGMSRLLVTGTYRDTDLDRTHPLSQALSEMNREDLFARILLRGLTDVETAAYIRDTAQSEPPADLVHRVHAETEGNPFFLSEVVRLMAEEGAFSERGTSQVRIPEGVKEALGRRLDKLSPEANELLSVAAVVGRECTHALLAALTDFDDDTLLGLIEEALRARVFEESGTSGEYRFTHALMQDALYAELSTARRVRMHGRVAETLEILHSPELEREAAQLARHFAEAAVMNKALAEKAVQYAELAAKQAEAAAAWDDAVRWYQAAVTSLQDDPDAAARRGDLLISLSVCLRFVGRSREGWAAFEQAGAEYRRQGDPRIFAEGIGRGLISSGPITDYVSQRGLLSEVLDGLRDEPSREACALLATLALSDRYPSGDAFAERARTMADLLQLDEADVARRRLAMRDTLRLLDQGDYERVATRSEQLYQAYGHGDGAVGPVASFAASSLGTTSNVLTQAGEIQRAEKTIREIIGFCTERRLSGRRALGFTQLARLALQRNQRDLFQELAREGKTTLFPLVAAEDALVRKEFMEAESLLPNDDEFNQGGRSRRTAIVALLGLHRGQVARTKQLFEDHRGGFEPGQTTAPLDRVSAFVFYGDSLVAFADSALAQSAYRDLLAAGWYRLDMYTGTPADVLRGGLALRLGDPDAAEAHYTEGLDWARRPDVRFGLVEGRCLQGLAEVAEARGDQATAMKHLDSAGAKFAEYGAKLYLDQVLAKKSVLKA